MTGAWDGAEGWTPEQVQTAPAKLPQQTSWTILLNYPRPLPGLSMNDRVNRYAKARNTKTIREQIFYMVRAAHVPALERISVDIIWVVADNRTRDGAENLAPWAKAIYDGIGSNRGVSARIVEDDSPAFMVKVQPSIRLDKTVAPHFEIVITDLGSAD